MSSPYELDAPTTCGAMRSPNSDTRYDCSRMDGHRGEHLDDAQNVLWSSEWDPAHDTTAVPLTEDRVNNAMMVLERRIREELARVMTRVVSLEQGACPDHRCCAGSGD